MKNIAHGSAYMAEAIANDAVKPQKHATMTPCDYITYQDAVEYETHQFSTCASDLSWPPGHFPEMVETNMGNGQPFVREAILDGLVRYAQANGCIRLTVYND